MPKLGVNIDHVATVRQARRTFEPDPVWAAAAAELGGADQITIHLREDRRHIQDRDLRLLKETVSVRLNLECACEAAMLEIACEVKPDQVCLVPEKREEVTTEGGLDVAGAFDRVAHAVRRLTDAGIQVSLFIDPDLRQIEAAVKCKAPVVELHTGGYAHAIRTPDETRELEKLRLAAWEASQRRLAVDAGHGLTYANVVPVAAIPEIRELNIGHSIISRSIFVGLTEAVREMKRLVHG
ncbi:MAG: pyridoxine 5'-phosphate synthase [Planctomycetota bacterium]|jgi:pyridoxine 5-phosphate synthase